MATAGFSPATVPDPICSIPTERIQLLSTSLLYCGLFVSERQRVKLFADFLEVFHRHRDRRAHPPLFQRIGEHLAVERVGEEAACLI